MWRWLARAKPPTSLSLTPISNRSMTTTSPTPSASFVQRSIGPDRSHCASTCVCSCSARVCTPTHRPSTHLRPAPLKPTPCRADDLESLMASRDLQFDLTLDDQGLFLAEVDELLQRVEESLVDLERAPDDQALLNEIFRAAHTIKGSSATIGHTRMASLTHAMETRLDDVRKRTASVTPELIEALLRALDVLKLLRDEVETRVAADVDVDAAAAAVERRAARRSLPVGAGDETLRLTVTLEDGPWAAVRALQALLALGEHGRVLSSDPSQADIEREDATIGRQLTVLVSSEKPV